MSKPVALVLCILPLFAATKALAEPRISGSPGPDCRSSCPARCSSMPCAGLNVSQCDRLRASCRRSCEQRCR